MKLKLILLFFKKNFFRSFFLIFVFFIIIFTIIISVFLQKNTKNFILKNTYLLKDEKSFILTAKNKNSFFDKQNKDLKKIYKNLKNDPNITELKAYFFPKVPTTIILDLLGKKFETDVFLYFTEEKNKNINTNKNYIELTISEKFLNLYNIELAGNSFFPRLDKNNISNLQLELCLNKSSFFSISKEICKKAKITHTSLESPLIGIIVNKEILEKYLKDKNKIKNAKIVKIIAKAKNKDYIEKLKINNFFKNVKIISQDNQKKEVNNKLKFFQFIIYSISFVIIFLSFIFLSYIIFSYFEMEKKIFLILYFDAIKTSKIFFIGFFYFLFIFFIGMFLNLLIIFFNQKIFIPYLNNLILKNFNINYEFYNISYLEFFIINFIILLIFSLIFSIIFYKQNSKNIG